MRCRANQHRKTARTGARCAEDADRKNQPRRCAHVWGKGASDREDDETSRQHASRSVAIRNSTRDRLHGTPDKLAHGHRKADAGNAETRGGVERRNEQAQRLSASLRHHHDGGRDQDYRPVTKLSIAHIGMCQVKSWFKRKRTCTRCANVGKPFTRA